MKYIWFVESPEQLGAQHPPPPPPLGCLLQKAFVGSNRNVRLDPRDTNTIATGANWELNERKINYAKTPY